MVEGFTLDWYWWLLIFALAMGGGIIVGAVIQQASQSQGKSGLEGHQSQGQSQCPPPGLAEAQGLLKADPHMGNAGHWQGRIAGGLGDFPRLRRSRERRPRYGNLC